MFCATLILYSGLQDTNLARIKITQDYLMKCDNVFIVAKISRAITDQSLKSSLYAVFSRHMPSEWEDAGGQRRKDFSISVICTKTEVCTLISVLVFSHAAANKPQRTLTSNRQRKDFAGKEKPFQKALATTWMNKSARPKHRVILF